MITVIKKTKQELIEQAITDAEDIRIKLTNGKMPIIETNELLDLLIHINKEYGERYEKWILKNI